MPINFAIKLAATVALEAAQVGLQALHKTQGPRLSETQVTTADYGTPIPRFKGARKFAGQIIWSKALEIVNHTSKIKGGGKQTTQSALWTAAVAFADCPQSIGPISKVLKIWLDETLAYDATGTGPISYASSLGFDLASVMRIYTGSEDQMPDPVYSAWCEDKYGPDSAPAFRELAYLFFDQMPCDNFGNRPPQITVLATTSAAGHFPYELHPEMSGTMYGAFFSPDRTRMVIVNGGSMEVYDVPTRTRIVGPHSAGGGHTYGSNPIVVNDDGSFYIGAGGGSEHLGAGLGVSLVSAEGVITELSASSILGGIWKADGVIYGRTQNTSANQYVYFDGANVNFVAATFFATHYFEDVDGNAWAVGCPVSGGSFTDSIGIQKLSGSGAGATALLPVSAAGEAFGLDNGAGGIFVRHSSYIYVIDKTTLAITAGPVSAPYNPPGVNGANDTPFRGSNPGDTSLWIGFTKYSTLDCSVLETQSPSSWMTGITGSNGALYDRVNDALWTRETGAFEAAIWFLDRAANAGVTLGDCVTAMCTEAGMSDFDASALTQTVLGYSWTRGDVKSQMQPLLDIHDVDARPHDFTIQFLPRGSASSETILTGDFAKNGDNARYTVTIAQDTDLPQTLRVNFADTGFDQQPNNIISVLPTDAVDSQRDDTIDLSTYADTPDGAQQKGDRYLRRQWLDRESLANSLTAQLQAIEPGDVKSLSLDGVVQNFRLTRQTFSAGRIDCTWTRDETSVATVNTNTTGPAMTRDTETIQIPAPVRGFVIDAPYRDDSDADTRPLLYAGAGAYGQLSFPGASVWEETGSGASAAYDTLLDRISTGATWGLCNGPLPRVPSPWMWDRGNVLNVSLQNGSLSSCAEADVDADPTLNLILVGSNSGGWEYANFTTATLQGDGSYNLSGFKRGRRGTEWMCGAHISGEAWVLASSLKTEAMGLDEVADSLSFKAQAIGRSLDSASVSDVAPFNGATLKPWAPARIEWTTDGTDMFGTIIRRTRIGGSWVGGSTIPLSENSEAYEVDIYHGSTFKRTISVSGGNTFTYTGADIAADGNTVGVAPPCNAYQLSDAVGRGFALAA